MAEDLGGQRAVFLEDGERSIGKLQEGLLQSIRFLMDRCRKSVGVHRVGVSMHCNNGPQAPAFTASSSGVLDIYADSFTDGNALCKVLYDLLKSHERAWGDCGWLCCFISSRLIELAYLSTKPTAEVISDVYKSFTKLQMDLVVNSPVIKIPIVWSDRETVLAVVAGVLRPTLSKLQFSPNQTQILSLSILSAFTSSIVGGSDGILSPFVQFEAVLSPITRSHLLTNALLMNIPYRDVFSRQFKIYNAKVALFEASLEVSLLRDGVSVEIEQSASRPSSSIASDIERQTMELYANIIAASGVEVLFCQKRIHSYLHNLLEKRNIMTIQRVSVRYISVLARLSGARLLGEMALAPGSSGSSGQPRLPLDTLGHLKSVQWKNYYGHWYLVCESYEESDFSGPLKDIVHANTRCRMLPVMTILLCSLTESSCDELKQVCERALKCLSNCLKEPFLLIGAGSWQYTLGCRQLKEHFPVLSRAGCLQGATSERFLGQALLEFAELITCNDYSDEINGNFEGASSSAICNNDEGGERVFDILSSALNALQCAVEAACCIIDIDGVVYAEE